MIDRYNPLLSKDISTSVEQKILGWEVNVSHIETELPEKAVKQGYKLLKSWQELFVPENTWVRQHVGVPSLITRIDATLDNEGNLLPYEIEERPGGIGAAMQFNTDFAQKLNQVMQSWPKIQAVISPKRIGYDDGYWLETVVGAENANPNKLHLVRAEPEETEFHQLEESSISSLKEKGNKLYGVQMGMWRLVSSTDQLDWDKPFALKPIQGSKSHDIRLWEPDPKKRRQQGFATRTKIEDTLAQHRVMYQQPFLSPIELNGSGRTLYMIYRVFYGYDLSEKDWKYLGGFYNVRPSVIIHGAKDTIFGPVIAKSTM